jgi:hypothetical protein
MKFIPETHVVRTKLYIYVFMYVYLQLFVGALMSYLPYLRLFAHSGFQRILRCVLFCFSSSCVTYVASFSVLSIFDCPFGIL